MSPWRAWMRAARLPSLLYLYMPLLLGHALATRDRGAVSLWVLFGLLFYGTCQQLYIVFANDCADEMHDRLNPNPTWLSGGSRVLVEGHLPSSALRRAAIAMAFLALLGAGALAWLSGAWILVSLALLGVALLWAYSFQPWRLSYRGGGELLQVAGLGVILPLMGYAAATGGVAGFPAWLWGSLLPLQGALALATTLPDETGDRVGKKRTLAVLWGGARVRWVMLCLLAGALGIWGVIYPLTGPWALTAWQHTGAGWGAVLCMLVAAWWMGRQPQVPLRALVLFAVGTAWVLLSWLALLVGDASGLFSG